jgi:hypothetical protein
MSEGKVIFDGGIKTQSVEAVKGLIEYLTGAKCQKLPAVVRLANGRQLTRSGKGDAYYVTSPRECSCPGFFYRRSCRHVKALRDQGEPKGVLLLDAYAFDVKPGEIEYWQKKEQQQAETLSPTQIFARDIVAAMES